MTNEEKFLNIKFDEICSSFSSDGDKKFEDYYDDVEDERLKTIFSIFHYQLNDLFEFMNYKNHFGVGGHYNAQQSRELIEIIHQLRALVTNLKNSEFSFKVDPYYDKILNLCEKFLKESGGSTIPGNFPRIEIIENKPIFSLSNNVTIHRVNNITQQCKLIGSGSYAQVFKYKDPFYNRYFAIKRAHKNLRPDELERFKNEYNVLKSLNSPYIVEVYNYNDEKNEYIMEYVDETLEKYISTRNNKLSMKKRIKLVMQLFTVFHYIHEKKLLHRDISYQNILVKEFEDMSTIIKVSDFGLVKFPDSTLTRESTEVKGLLNDPNLAIVGFKNYNIKHEIYALTQIITYILTGKKTGTYIEDSEIREFMLKGMEPDLNKRIGTVKELQEEFNKFKPYLLKNTND